MMNHKLIRVWRSNALPEVPRLLQKRIPPKGTTGSSLERLRNGSVVSAPARLPFVNAQDAMNSCIKCASRKDLTSLIRQLKKRVRSA